MGHCTFVGSDVNAALQVNESVVTLSGSDEKVIIAFEVSEGFEAVAWAWRCKRVRERAGRLIALVFRLARFAHRLSVSAAIIEADDSKGYLKFGWLDRKGKHKWVALTKKEIFWFNNAQRLEQLR